MQVVVKTPHIEVNIQGKRIPKNLMKVLKQDFKNDVKIITNSEDEKVNIFESDWYKKQKKKMSPGKALKVYRSNSGLSQKELGQKLGNTAPQTISNMENGIRNISLKTAKKLAELFHTSVENFI